MYRQEGEHLLGHCAVEGDLVVGESNAAAHKTCRAGSSRGIEDLAKTFGSVVAGIQHWDLISGIIWIGHHQNGTQ